MMINIEKANFDPKEWLKESKVKFGNVNELIEFIYQRNDFNIAYHKSTVSWDVLAAITYQNDNGSSC